VLDDRRRRRQYRHTDIYIATAILAPQMLLSQDTLRTSVGRTLRELRRARRWTQAELSGRLGLSQSRLSEIESGASSLTAEQFLVLLGLFNVGASHFTGTPKDPTAELQNVLARLGATHLHESDDVVTREALDDVATAVKAALTSASPRLLTALAPVLVEQVDRLNLRKLRADLVELGFERRLDWLLDNTREALEEELRGAPPPAWARRYRRARTILELALDATPAVGHDEVAGPPDVLDAGVRSKQTLKEVLAASSSLSRRLGIASSLHPKDFAEALRGARNAG
jgi:HTH-type transcriptional regulator/antitoxin HipB